MEAWDVRDLIDFAQGRGYRRGRHAYIQRPDKAHVIAWLRRNGHCPIRLIAEMRGGSRG